MKQYHDYLRHIMENGVVKTDRTGTGTVSVFGYQMRYDLKQGFPLVTTKKVHLKSIIHELLWFIKGDTNIQYLKDNGVSIWDEWAKPDGSLGPVYGKQWREWIGHRFVKTTDLTPEIHEALVKRGFERYDDFTDGEDTIAVYQRSIDQLINVINRIKSNPDCRRLIVTAWNVDDLDEMALMPCHAFFQFYVADGKLSCQLYQRKDHCALAA